VRVLELNYLDQGCATMHSTARAKTHHQIGPQVHVSSCAS